MQFSFAATYLFSCICLSFVLPEILDLHTDNYKASDDANKDDGGSFSKMQLILNPNFFFALITGSWGYFQYDYITPILALRIKDFELTQS